MEDRLNYGNERKAKKTLFFENCKALIYEYDCSQMEEEAFAQALEEAQRTNPKTMKEFLFALHRVLSK